MGAGGGVGGGINFDLEDFGGSISLLAETMWPFSVLSEEKNAGDEAQAKTNMVASPAELPPEIDEALDEAPSLASSSQRSMGCFLLLSSIQRLKSLPPLLSTL